VTWPGRLRVSTSKGMSSSSEPILEAESSEQKIDGARSVLPHGVNPSEASREEGPIRPG
jgi:hypothetical protein